MALKASTFGKPSQAENPHLIYGGATPFILHCHEGHYRI
jgi:hypothetical protein